MSWLREPWTIVGEIAGNGKKWQIRALFSKLPSFLNIHITGIIMSLPSKHFQIIFSLFKLASIPASHPSRQQCSDLLSGLTGSQKHRQGQWEAKRKEPVHCRRRRCPWCVLAWQSWHLQARPGTCLQGTLIVYLQVFQVQGFLNPTCPCPSLQTLGVSFTG